MHLNIAFTFIVALGSVVANPVAKPQSSVDTLAPALAAREDFSLVGRLLKDVPHQKQQLREVQVRDVGYPAPNSASVFEKRAWLLNGRILRIAATITVAAGQVLNEIYDVIFGGPGQVNPSNNNVIHIDATEIDEGADTFQFEFTGVHDGWRWHGEINLDEQGGINHVVRTTRTPLERQVGNHYVAMNPDNLALACGFPQ